MSPELLDAARGVARIAAHTNLTHAEQVDGVRRALACLEVIPYGDLFEPIPTSCGHPSSRLVRGGTSKGTICLDCRHDHYAARNARNAARREALS